MTASSCQRSVQLQKNDKSMRHQQGNAKPSQPNAAPALTLMKPMSLAYWRKHCRHMFSPYLRIRPWRLEHTRLRREKGAVRAGNGGAKRGGRPREKRTQRRNSPKNPAHPRDEHRPRAGALAEFPGMAPVELLVPHAACRARNHERKMAARACANQPCAASRPAPRRGPHTAQSTGARARRAARAQSVPLPPPSAT